MPATSSAETTFRETLDAAVRRSGAAPRPLTRGECRTSDGRICTLCHARVLGYPEELSLKSSALREYWARRVPDVPLESLVPSPRGRAYRSVSKRKVHLRNRTPVLGLIDPEQDTAGGLLPVGRCAIEPAEHAQIYRETARWLEHPAAADIARVLRYVIVRGTGGEQALILSVREIHPSLTRVLNQLSRAVTGRVPSVVSVFLHHEPEDDRYYLGKSAARGRTRARKLFGRADLRLDVDGKHFRFSPLSFSQVNISLLPALTAATGTMLELSPEETLFDLYCGYGLFGLLHAGRVRRVVGIESSPEAVAAAVENARRQHASQARFFRAAITEESLAPKVHGMDERSAVLLDPPRTGTAPGVLELIAEHRPGRVVHIFCNIDLLPRELERWRTAGYRPVRAVPFDMFPGTAAVETVVLLTPAA